MFQKSTRNSSFFQNCGFVTFETAESAENAISEFNGSVTSGIQLEVSMARRQPVFDSFLSLKGRHKNNEQNNEFGPDIEIIDSDNCSENGDVEFKNVNQGWVVS